MKFLYYLLLIGAIVAQDDNSDLLDVYADEISDILQDIDERGTSGQLVADSEDDFGLFDLSNFGRSVRRQRPKLPPGVNIRDFVQNGVLDRVALRAAVQAAIRATAPTTTTSTTTTTTTTTTT